MGHFGSQHNDANGKRYESTVEFGLRPTFNQGQNFLPEALPYLPTPFKQGYSIHHGTPVPYAGYRRFQPSRPNGRSVAELVK